MSLNANIELLKKKASFQQVAKLEVQARQSRFEENSLFLPGPDLSRNAKIEHLQPSAVWGGGGQGTLTHADLFWSHLTKFGLGRAKLKKKASFQKEWTCCERPKLNFGNQVQFFVGP